MKRRIPVRVALLSLLGLQLLIAAGLVGVLSYRGSTEAVDTVTAALHEELALRIGYSGDDDDIAPESVLLEEIQYHTQTVRQIFDRRIREARERYQES